MAVITLAGVSCLLQSDAVGRTSFPQEGGTKSEGASVLGQGPGGLAFWYGTPAVEAFWKDGMVLSS